jgi:hypothetical protein
MALNVLLLFIKRLSFPPSKIKITAQNFVKIMKSVFFTCVALCYEENRNEEK